MFDMTLLGYPQHSNNQTASIPTIRLMAEFREMPGLRLTAQQTARLIGIDLETASTTLAGLVERGFLRRTASGYILA